MSSALLDLSESDIKTLASVLRSGRLSAPFSTLGLQRLLGSYVPAGLAEWMTAIASSGCSSTAMAAWLEAFAEAFHRRTPVEHAVQLVTTAPAGSVGVHRDTAVVVQDLFRRSQKSVLISTYAFYGGREIFQTLAERMAANVDLEVKLFANIERKAGDNSSEGEIVNRFVKHFREQQWPDHCRMPQVYYDVRSMDANRIDSAVLHAKCILIDDAELFVTSANFTEAAQLRNLEVGLTVKSPTICRQVASFFDSLVSSGHCRRAVL